MPDNNIQLHVGIVLYLMLIYIITFIIILLIYFLLHISFGHTFHMNYLLLFIYLIKSTENYSTACTRN